MILDLLGPTSVASTLSSPDWKLSNVILLLTSGKIHTSEWIEARSSFLWGRFTKWDRGLSESYPIRKHKSSRNLIEQRILTEELEEITETFCRCVAPPVAADEYRPVVFLIDFILLPFPYDEAINYIRCRIQSTHRLYRCFCRLIFRSCFLRLELLVYFIFDILCEIVLLLLCEIGP